MHIVCPACMAVNRVPAERLRQGPTCGKCKSALLDGRVVALNQANFAEFIGRNELPVIVDFWAAWCAPCQAMAPVFAQLAGELATQMRFANVDTEREPSLAGQWGIRSIPALILFKQGREVKRSAGALTAAQLRQWLSS